MMESIPILFRIINTVAIWYYYDEPRKTKKDKKTGRKHD